MARIRGRDTHPERLLARRLWGKGLRYRLHAGSPVGRPDIVFPGKRTAVFIDGCFWHGCPDHYVRPNARSEFWATKLRSNVERDVAQTRALEQAGWTVLRFWEHEVWVALGECVRHVGAVLEGSVSPPVRSWRVVAVEPLKDRFERRHLIELRGRAADRFVVRRRRTTKWSRGLQ